MLSKKIKAPAYFVNEWNRALDMKERIKREHPEYHRLLELLSVTNDPDTFDELRKYEHSLTSKDRIVLNSMIRSINVIKELSWDLFIMNNHGFAGIGQLEYDENSKEIKYQPIKKVLKNMVDKIFDTIKNVL